MNEYFDPQQDKKISRKRKINSPERKGIATHKRSASLDIKHVSFAFGDGKSFVIDLSPTNSPVNLDNKIHNKTIDLDKVTEESNKFQSFLELSIPLSEAGSDSKKSIPRYYELPSKLDNLDYNFMLSPCSYMAECNKKFWELPETQRRDQSIYFNQELSSIDSSNDEHESWESESQNTSLKHSSGSYRLFQKTYSIPRTVLARLTKRLEIALRKKRNLD